jgi:hypothetical protein
MSKIVIKPNVQIVSEKVGISAYFIMLSATFLASYQIANAFRPEYAWNFWTIGITVSEALILFIWLALEYGVRMLGIEIDTEDKTIRRTLWGLKFHKTIYDKIVWATEWPEYAKRVLVVIKTTKGKELFLSVLTTGVISDEFRVQLGAPVEPPVLKLSTEKTGQKVSVYHFPGLPPLCYDPSHEPRYYWMEPSRPPIITPTTLTKQ